MESIGHYIGMGVTGSIAILFFSIAFWQMSVVTGSMDNWADVKKQVGVIVGLDIAGTVFLGALAVLVSMQFVDTIPVAYVSIFISIFAACMSFGALATAAITR